MENAQLHTCSCAITFRPCFSHCSPHPPKPPPTPPSTPAKTAQTAHFKPRCSSQHTHIEHLALTTLPPNLLLQHLNKRRPINRLIRHRITPRLQGSGVPIRRIRTRRPAPQSGAVTPNSFRSAAAVCGPDISGMCISRIISANGRPASRALCRAAAIASVPVDAAATVAPAFSKNRSTSHRICGSSSAIKTDTSSGLTSTTAGAAAPVSARCRGNVNVKIAPRSGGAAFAAVTDPPSSVASCREIANPSPVPPNALLSAW